MKKLTILVVALFGIFAALDAKPVDVATAATVAARFHQAPMRYTLPNGSVRVPHHMAASQLTLVDDTYSAFYIFSNPNGKGFVMIAKDDRLSPVIAYSDNSPWSTENMPDNLSEWLDGYCSMMPYLSGEQSAETAAEWQALLSANYEIEAPSVPLMETRWGQKPYYNALCPTNEKEGQAVTGCVATAFAQILRYWKYPEHGWGFHAYTDKRYGYLSADFSQHYYDWEHMPAELNETSDSTEILAVARLMSDCGIAVDMGYGPRGSGAATPLIATRIVRYFGYKPTALLIERANYSNDEDWVSVIRNEIDNKRVMIYRGTGSRGGHCFVCDGYDSSSRIHINWGWMGNCDGYFSVKAMNPLRGETVYDFTQDQMAIIGIEPDSTKKEDAVAITYAAPWKIVSEVNDITYGVPFTLQTKVANEGQTITCDLMAMLFDKNGDYLQSWTIESGFTMNAHEQKEIQVDSIGKMNLLPGEYQMALYVMTPDSLIFFINTDDEDLQIDYGLYSFSVKHWNAVEMNGDIIVNDTLPIVVRGEKTQLSAHISYVGQSSYTGAFHWALYELNQATPRDVLSTGYLNDWSGMDTTLQAIVTPLVPQGTYRLALLLEGDGGLIPVGCRYYSNPIKLIVQDTVAIDRYEPNDVPELATPVAVDFGDQDTIMVFVNDVSIHQEEDIDYYVLQFPKDDGYEYEQIADVTYSEHPYMEAPVDVFQVEDKWVAVPQFEGITGYYALWFMLIRKPTSAINTLPYEEGSAKFLHNGQLIIRKDGKHFNALGQEVR